MGRSETYPWSLLTEVGDYFCVMTETKPFSYMSMLVSQRNYRFKDRKFSCVKTSYGSIVLLAQLLDETPPYEFNHEGILCSTSRQHLIRSHVHAPDPAAPGERPVAPPRTQQQIVAMMSPEQREYNLPWWKDPKTGQLLFNGKVATMADAEKWVSKTWRPDPDAPYPDYYHLDENLQRKSRDQLMMETEEDEEDWGSQVFEPGDGSGLNLGEDE